MLNRLLHPQHLDRIRIGQNQYRLSLAPQNPKTPKPHERNRIKDGCEGKKEMKMVWYAFKVF